MGVFPAAANTGLHSQMCQSERAPRRDAQTVAAVLQRRKRDGGRVLGIGGRTGPDPNLQCAAGMGVQPRSRGVGETAVMLSSRCQHHGVVVFRIPGWFHRSFAGIDGHPQAGGTSQALARQYAQRDQWGETDVLILIREFIDATLFDYTSYARFYDLLEKRAGIWRIVEWNCIYDKDRLDPVV